MTKKQHYTKPSIVKAGDIEMAWDAFGYPDAPPVLLIMGLGVQMIGWDDEFCAQLSAKGFRVIRFDNRDMGLSSSMDALGIPHIGSLLKGLAQGKPVSAPYLLRDMADDAIHFMDALGIASAHMVGASMGGMIAQLAGIHYPKRVKTLTSIMSTTGEPGLPGPTPQAMEVLMTPYPMHREGYIDRAEVVARVLSGPGLPFDAKRARKLAERAYDRSFNPMGFARQYAAILASGSRRSPLTSLAVPTLVVHGDADPLVPVACGIDTAEAVPGAKLLIIEGMGHDLPPGAWPRIIDAVASHCAI